MTALAEGPVLAEAGDDDARQLWMRLPPDTAAMFRPHIIPVADHVLHELRRLLPEHDRLAGSAEVTVEAVSRTIRQCLAATGPSATGPAAPVSGWDWAMTFRAIGRKEFRAGRSLDRLLSAYRVAGRSAWRYLAGVARHADLCPELICMTAEAIFATIDEICSLIVSGYSEERVRSAGTAEPQRARLLALLLSEPPPTSQEIATCAQAAGWAVPETVVAVALEPSRTGGPDAALALSAAVLRDLDSAQPCLVTADPGLHLARLDVRLRGRRAAIGPPVPPAEAAWSLSIARRALGLGGRGVLPDRPVLDCSEHLVDLMLVADPVLVARLSERALGPFGDLPQRQRERLEQTMLVWLQSRGNPVEAAERLEVHPQTVRYRMRQIADLFGGALDDSESRFALEAALRANRLLGVR